MPLPSTYQARTAATFATNGSLFTKNTAGYGYRDLTVASPHIKDLNVSLRNSRLDGKKRGYSAKLRYVVPATPTTASEMCDVTISVTSSLGATVAQSTQSIMMVELVDFLIAQISVLNAE